MTGLFDSLAARFAPGAQPAIRPRPQARFEGGTDAMGLREEAAQTVARPAPRPPSPQPQRAPASLPRKSGQADMVQSTPSPARAPPPPDAKLDSVQSAPLHPVVRDGDPAAATQDIPVRLDRTHSEQQPRSQPQRRTQVGMPEPRPDTSGESPDIPSAPPERIIETSVQAEPPASKMDRLTDPPTHPVAEPASAPTAASTPPVIRIGRIEVSRPAAPASPPPAPAPARPEPPRRGGPAARTPAPSGLTDYLGWKKR
ncbi:hypothetical protein [Roseovarius sp. M141]|uniref:hypothetical protein n=1 Tax=Roseovarius sp. M141 TaxID=2583806 RepID=UPI0020CC48CA|nr:hypothetical protein [Roseovarius sp. M141]MCQ0091222.1 hypothetical protein [Roseovarius sp. M141]